MTTELFANSPTPGSVSPLATLRAPITTMPSPGTVESYPVSATAPAALQASSGQFRVIVDEEIMLVAASLTGVSPWSFTRGQEGTSPTPHAVGAPIYHVPTAGALQALQTQATAAAEAASDALGAASTAQATAEAFATAAVATETTRAEAAEATNATAITTEATARAAGDAALIPLTQKGAASGVATLDSGSHVPVAQLPTSVVTVSSGSPTNGQVPVFTGVGNQVVPGAGSASAAVNVRSAPYSAKGDGRQVTDATISASSNQLHSNQAAFTNADVGKLVVINKAGAALAGPPASPTATPVAATTGIFSAGTYYWKVTAFRGGQTLGSSEASATIAANGSCNLAWTAVTGADGYCIYRATTSGGQTGASSLIDYVYGGATTSYTDVGRAALPSSGAIPSSDTSQADLVTTIASVSGGVATLNATATTAVSGGTAYFGTDDWAAIQGAIDDLSVAGYNQGGQVDIPAANLDAQSFNQGGYILSQALDLTNAANITLHGDGRPVLWYAGASGPGINACAVLTSTLEEFQLLAINSACNGDLVVVDNPNYTFIGSLVGAINNSQTTITLSAPVPARYAKTPNGVAAIYIDFGTGSQEELLVTGGFGTTTPTVQRGFRSTAVSHNNGAPVVKQWLIEDTDELKIRDCVLGNQPFNFSLNSLLRLNHVISSSVKGNTFAAGDARCSVLLGNTATSSGNDVFNQGNQYVNVVGFEDNIYQKGTVASILVAASDCEALRLSHETFEPLAGGYAGAVDWISTCNVYSVVIDDECWFGDAAGGRAWISLKANVVTVIGAMQFDASCPFLKIEANLVNVIGGNIGGGSGSYTYYTSPEYTPDKGYARYDFPAYTVIGSVMENGNVLGLFSQPPPSLTFLGNATSSTPNVPPDQSSGVVVGGSVTPSNALTFTNKRITNRVVTVTQSATPSINTDNTDVASITGLAQAITSMTSGLSGTPVDGDELLIRITDNGTARAITWGASFEASTVTLPTTTVANALLGVFFIWNGATAKWRCVGVA